MKKFIPFMISGGLLASILLAGCSTDTNTEAAAVSTQTDQAQTDNSAAQPAPSAGANENGNPDRAMSVGKIKSISESTITIYTADMTMAPGQNAGGNGEGTPQGDQGAAPQGDTGGEQGTAPEGGMQEGGGGMKGGGMGGRMQQSFSEETTDITIGADTTITSVTFDNGAQTESTLSLSDLKADDIIRYTLKTDTTEAASVTLSNGTPGGGMPGGTESTTSTN